MSNDNEREQWVNNDEGLYDMYKRWRRHNKGGMRGFIRANRAEIDSLITGVSDGSRRAHDLKYGTGLANHRSPFGPWS